MAISLSLPFTPMDTKPVPSDSVIFTYCISETFNWSDNTPLLYISSIPSFVEYNIYVLDC